jgi:hypothetical protein
METKTKININVMAEWTGLEPATPGVTGRYSNQLNYHSKRTFNKRTSSLWLPGQAATLSSRSWYKPCQTWRPLGDSNPCNHRERVVS